MTNDSPVSHIAVEEATSDTVSLGGTVVALIGRNEGDGGRAFRSPLLEAGGYLNQTDVNLRR